MRLFVSIVTACVLLLAEGAAAVDAIPPLTSRVTDVAGALSASDRSMLETKLAALEREKGAQIAVLIVPTTNGEAIEEYALRAAESWKIGRGGTDDGVVFVIAKNDRRMRIEVGYGLEGAIPDARAKRIIDEIAAPAFREGDMRGGILAAVDTLAALVRGEPLPPPPAARGASRRGGGGDVWPLVLFFSMMLGGILRSALGPGLGALATGTLVGLFSALFVSFGVALLFGIVAALMAFFFNDPSVMSPYGRRTYSRSRYGRRGGWGYGGGLPGGFGGGGGFRGGGGRFGGGGASGSW